MQSQSINLLDTSELMNIKANKWQINPCTVCAYPLSDAHHYYPKARGGKETIYLCPNHHRFANIIQTILINGGLSGTTKAENFAKKHFDDQFNENVLQKLIGSYLNEACAIAEQQEEKEYRDFLRGQIG